MNFEKLKFIFKFFAVIVVVVVLFVGSSLGLYLKVLPMAVSDKKVIQYVENLFQKAYYLDVKIKNPVLKTEISPII